MKKIVLSISILVLILSCLLIPCNSFAARIDDMINDPINSIIEDNKEEDDKKKDDKKSILDDIREDIREEERKEEEKKSDGKLTIDDLIEDFKTVEDKDHTDTSSDVTVLDDPLEDPVKYLPGSNWRTNSSSFIKIGNNILGAIRIFGSAVAVIVLMWLGIKYMVGSVSDKAEYKQTMIPYIIGAVMLFAIPNIIGIIFGFVTKDIVGY